MNPVDPTYRPYGEVINVMTVIEELRANLSFPLEMQTSTRKSIYKNTRGPNPLYKPEALPSRTMQFMKEGFLEIGRGPGDKRKKGAQNKLDLSEQIKKEDGRFDLR